MEKNINEEISRIKSIINFMNENELPKNSGDLIRMLPEKLKELFFNQWKAKQNPK